MAKAPNIVPLKLLVISLGFLLVGGTIFVVCVLISKTGKIAEATCRDVTVSIAGLGQKGQLTGTTAKENMIQLVFTDAATNTVVTLDRCSGAVQQRFTITP